MEDYVTSGDFDFDFSPVRPARSLSIFGLIFIILTPIAIVIGCIASLLATVIIIKRRLWIQHEGYFYLIAILVTNVFIIVFHFIPFWFSLLKDNNFYEFNNFTCKLATYIHGATGMTIWQMVAFLFGVYFRGKLTPEGGRCCSCPVFAGKFCILKTAKIITITTACLFAIGNLWKLWAFHIVVEGYFKRTYRYCSVDESWVNFSNVWRTVGVVSDLIVPLALILILVIMIACNRRCNARIPDQEMDEGRNLDREFFRISICLGVVTFIWKFAVYLFWGVFMGVMEVHYTEIITQMVGVAIVPILCLALLTQLRAKLRSKCCKEDFPASVEGGRTNKLELGTAKKTCD